MWRVPIKLYLQERGGLGFALRPVSWLLLSCPQLGLSPVLVDVTSGILSVA